MTETTARRLNIIGLVITVSTVFCAIVWGYSIFSKA